MINLKSASAKNTEAAAAKLAPHLSPPARIYLSGDIGGGKTTWTRALLRALGEGGIVPSPTFALALSYQTKYFVVHHLDLFRESGEVGDDLRELIDDENAVCILEWPRAGLPPPDVSMHFDFAKKDNGRAITMRAENERAKGWLRAFY